MNSKGLMGIGTLIIFIAIILVAAVAAMVLINTSSSLQQKALTTGKQTDEDVSAGVEVTSIWGGNASDGTIDEMYITLRLRAGSSPLKLSSAVFTQDTQYTSQEVEYGGSSTAASTTEFTVNYLQRSPSNSPGYLSFGDVARITYLIKKVGGQLEGLGEAEEVMITFVPTVGQPIQVSFFTPSSIKKERILLYP